jgi:hypothetical protein
MQQQQQLPLLSSDSACAADSHTELALWLALGAELLYYVNLALVVALYFALAMCVSLLFFFCR